MAFVKAAYYVATDNERPLKMFFNAADALFPDQYPYVTAFDIHGEVVQEIAQVEGQPQTLIDQYNLKYYTWTFVF